MYFRLFLLPYIMRFWLYKSINIKFLSQFFFYSLKNKSRASSKINQASKVLGMHEFSDGFLLSSYPNIVKLYWTVFKAWFLCPNFHMRFLKFYADFYGFTMKMMNILWRLWSYYIIYTKLMFYYHWCFENCLNIYEQWYVFSKFLCF